MIRALLAKRIDRLEKDLGVPADYVRHILRVSLRAFLAFARIGPLASYRRVLPALPRHVATLVATRHEDCGTCVQIGVNLARKVGVPASILRAVLDRRPDDLPGELADVYRFTEAVVELSGREDEYRERIRARYGEEALIELAMAIASCRFFPTTKRALGYARSCALVPVEV